MYLKKSSNQVSCPPAQNSIQEIVIENLSHKPHCFRSLGRFEKHDSWSSEIHILLK